MSNHDERPIPMGPGGDSAPQAPPRTASERLAAALPRSVLTLSVIDPAPVGITIDGTFHRIRFADDFTLTQHARLQRLHRTADELSAIGTEDLEALTPEQEDALNDALGDAYREMARLYLPSLTPETAAALSYLQCRGIIDVVFTQVAEREARKATAGLATAARPTGGRSSRPSATATATGGTGGRKRRSGTSSRPTTTSPA